MFGGGGEGSGGAQPAADASVACTNRPNGHLAPMRYSVGVALQKVSMKREGRHAKPLCLAQLNANGPTVNQGASQGLSRQGSAELTLLLHTSILGRR
jgi:hypothetical protein